MRLRKREEKSLKYYSSRNYSPPNSGPDSDEDPEEVKNVLDGSLKLRFWKSQLSRLPSQRKPIKEKRKKLDWQPIKPKRSYHEYHCRQITEEEQELDGVNMD